MIVLFILDGHCDSMCNVVDEKRSLLSCNGAGQLDLLSMKEYGVSSQVFAIYVEDTYCPDSITKRALKMINMFLKEMNENRDIIIHVKDLEDIEKAVNESKLSAFLSLEGGEALGGELFMLELFYFLGVRLMGLTWNRRNEIADGVGEGLHSGGLTNFGRSVVKKMNELGMVVDVSHISEKGFFDVMDISSAPVIASHSNCRVISDNKRNLSDEQIRLIANSNGVVGLTFVKPFIGENKANLNGLIDHIEHISELVGVDYIAIGSDFDGVTEEYMPDDIRDLSVFPRLIDGLKIRGFKENEVEKIMGLNLLRVIKDVMR